MPKRDASFLAFFLAWADHKGWTVPDCHVIAAHWLENRGRDAVFMAFRGFSKSTLLACYNAWQYWRDPTYRILHQGDQDGTAYKTSRDTKAVLLRHPWTRIRPQDITGEIAFWRVAGNEDERNPSMQAAGIMSNVTSSRADEAQNDDVEVPRNINTPEAREKLRHRLEEQTHILVPGGRKLFIGTPHTYDSIYEERIAAGADVLRLPLFEQEHRLDASESTERAVPFRPEVVFAGIGKTATLLEEGRDWTYAKGRMTLRVPAGGVVDCYAGNAWPDRFTTDELLKRRRETRTLNGWDSQYQLHARPVNQVRLDPDRLIPYDVEPNIVLANRSVGMWLGRQQIMSATLRLDPSAGKKNSDVNALALILSDSIGNSYWHRAIGLTGELAEFDHTGRVVGGSVMQVCDVVAQFQLSRVDCETNGVGAHVPNILRGAFKARGLRCAVLECPESRNKATKILGGLEPGLQSGTLWAHVSVIETVRTQMREWNPAITEQPDDYLDAAAGAILAEPCRIGKVVAGTSEQMRREWRPTSGVYEATLDFSD
jgi:hypothetical protein